MTNGPIVFVKKAPALPPARVLPAPKPVVAPAGDEPQRQPRKKPEKSVPVPGIAWLILTACSTYKSKKNLVNPTKNVNVASVIEWLETVDPTWQRFLNKDIIEVEKRP
jgi:hypothetical protein